MSLSCCAEPSWVSELDLGHAGGFEFMLGRCGGCGASWMHVFATPANAEGYVPVAADDVARMRAAALGPDRKALMRRWAEHALEPTVTDPPYCFAFYERVRIVGDRSSLAEVRGEVGAVLGRAFGPDGASYAVWVYADEATWAVDEGDLEATGEHDRRETFYDDSVPRLRVSPEGEALGWTDPDDA